jgi:carboxymethylenebutenolidase
MGNFIDLKAADGTAIPAYVAQPAGAPKGGIVVIQEIFGVNSHIRAVADGSTSCFTRRRVISWWHRRPSTA